MSPRCGLPALPLAAMRRRARRRRAVSAGKSPRRCPRRCYPAAAALGRASWEGWCGGEMGRSGAKEQAASSLPSAWRSWRRHPPPYPPFPTALVPFGAVGVPRPCLQLLAPLLLSARTASAPSTKAIAGAARGCPPSARRSRRGAVRSAVDPFAMIRHRGSGAARRGSAVAGAPETRARVCVRTRMCGFKSC